MKFSSSSSVIGDVSRGMTGMGIWLLLPLLLTHCASLQAKNLNGFDLSNTQIPLREIAQGGPPRDGIPAIDAPRFDSEPANHWLEDNDRVLGVHYNGVAKAYPVSIMNWHEVVNDTFGDAGVLVSYCPLCGTGMAFLADIQGERLSFGVSGLLFRSDVLFYDRQHNSLWSQLDRTAISGPKRGQTLTQIPMEHSTWGQWRARHPQTLLLSRNQGFARDYTDDPYAGYENSKRLFFRVAAKIPKTYHTKERVLGIRRGALAIAIPFIEMRKQGKNKFALDFAEESLTVHWDPQANTARVVGAQNKPVVHTIAFWFAWYAFHPDTKVFTAQP